MFRDERDGPALVAGDYSNIAERRPSLTFNKDGDENSISPFSAAKSRTQDLSRISAGDVSPFSAAHARQANAVPREDVSPFSRAQRGPRNLKATPEQASINVWDQPSSPQAEQLRRIRRISERRASLGGAAEQAPYSGRRHSFQHVEVERTWSGRRNSFQHVDSPASGFSGRRNSLQHVEVASEFAPARQMASGGSARRHSFQHDGEDPSSPQAAQLRRVKRESSMSASPQRSSLFASPQQSPSPRSMGSVVANSPAQPPQQVGLTQEMLDQLGEGVTPTQAQKNGDGPRRGGLSQEALNQLDEGLSPTPGQKAQLLRQREAEQAEECSSPAANAMRRVKRSTQQDAAAQRGQQHKIAQQTEIVGSPQADAMRRVKRTAHHEQALVVQERRWSGEALGEAPGRAVAGGGAAQERRWSGEALGEAPGRAVAGLGAAQERRWSGEATGEAAAQPRAGPSQAVGAAEEPSSPDASHMRRVKRAFWSAQAQAQAQAAAQAAPRQAAPAAAQPPRGAPSFAGGHAITQEELNTLSESCPHSPEAWAAQAGAPATKAFASWGPGPPAEAAPWQAGSQAITQEELNRLCSTSTNSPWDAYGHGGRGQAEIGAPSTIGPPRRDVWSTDTTGASQPAVPQGAWPAAAQPRGPAWQQQQQQQQQQQWEPQWQQPQRGVAISQQELDSLSFSSPQSPAARAHQGGAAPRSAAFQPPERVAEQRHPAPPPAGRGAQPAEEPSSPDAAHMRRVKRASAQGRGGSVW